MRLFLGIEIPEDLKWEMQEFLVPLQKSPKGWVAPHDFHLTLLFIGEASVEERDEIIRRMPKIQMNPFELSTDKIDFFPRRVMFFSVAPSDELAERWKKVNGEFSEWREPGAKDFTAHITVKRWQRHEFDLLSSTTNDFAPHTFKVNSLTLFKSEKDGNNNKYHVIHRTPL